MLDDWLLAQENRGLRSLRTTRAHLEPIRAAFGRKRVASLTTDSFERYKRDRIDEGRAAATANRELECLRSALRYASSQTPPLIPASMVPSITMLHVENTRTGFFTVAEVGALLAEIDDTDVADFIEWAWLTGMRRGEISQLTWEMLDRSESTWVLRIPGSIVKNKAGRSFGFAGETRTIMERRIKARRLGCSLIFHRGGRKVGPFRDRWRSALKAAGLPPGRLFHDLRRSAVRTLIRSGVDASFAMKVSGHKTRSMLGRYNIIEEAETAAALQTAEAWLQTQPKARNLAAMGKRTGTIPVQSPSAAARPLENQEGNAGAGGGT